MSPAQRTARIKIKSHWKSIILPDHLIISALFHIQYLTFNTVFKNYIICLPGVKTKYPKSNRKENQTV